MFIPDLLWLLLPVAAAAGWLAAKLSDSRKTRAFWDYTSEFHQGLNVLLSHKQEKPVELFNNATDTDRNTAETHIALGNHYRQRGDMERSVFMHQGVIANEKLDDDIRALARFELAKDFDAAGLLDRSQAEFRQLIESGHRLTDAYESLLQLHERGSDWAQAIEVAKAAKDDTQCGLDGRIAHYHCEIAKVLLSEQHEEQATAELLKALDCDDQCARASMMLAELALQAKNFAEANVLYERVEQLRPELIPEIIDKRFDVLRQAGDDAQFDAFVRRIYAQRNAYSVIRSTREVIAQRHSTELADRFFKDQILKRPSLKGLRDWAHDQVELSKPGERDNVHVICDLLDKVVEDKPAYRCHQCGFQGNVMHWRCPSCEQWDSVSTIIGIEGE